MITIVMATRDRAGSLGRTLAALACQAMPPGSWDLVVADNGSRDATPAVLAAASRWLELTVVAAPEPGMTAALNRAVAAARGDLIVKCDDDLLPDPGWLRAYADAAAAFPETVFGGTTEVEWPAPPPDWLWRDARALGVLFAVTRERPGPCSPLAIWGPHWAARRAALEGARFDETIGPGAAGRPAMGGETELFQRLANAGHRGRIVGAHARHIVRPEQLEEAWVLARARACGRGAARLGRARQSRLRRAAWGLAAMAARPLPRSALRTRVLFTDSLLGGMRDALAA